MKQPVALVILDGWGINPSCDNNAVCLANTPKLDALLRDCPSTQIGASGLNVGLPEGQMGNSEVGHLNIGAGRIIYQELTRISKSVMDGDFFRNPTLLAAIAAVKASGGTLHLHGLLSDGGVHSHNSHLYALVQLARDQGLQKIAIHAFLDGRDTPPQSGAGYLAELETQLQQLGAGYLATVTGRFYAMDRDNRWARVEKAYRAMVEGCGIAVASSAEAIAGAYAAGQTDEFVEPRVIQSQGVAVARIVPGDGMICFNFRSDRAREITRAFTQKDFPGFARGPALELAAYVCLTEYDETFGLPIAFGSVTHRRLLGEVVADAGMHQLRIAETEKYAHVTFFFNGGSETPYPNEDRALIPSPKEVATYDLKPSMSADALTDEVLARIASDRYDLIILNFANPDMVGHTGVLAAAIEAMETVDRCAGRVVDAVLAAGGRLLITADHGNCEQMVDERGKPHTAHTTNPVPLILVDPSRPQAQLRPGRLADIAPTLLEMLGLEQPAEMTGRSLLQPN